MNYYGLELNLLVWGIVDKEMIIRGDEEHISIFYTVFNIQK